MSATWGKNIKLTIFGESHGKAIGGIIDGLPAGIVLDLDYVREDMMRRAPGNSKLSTPRKEGDDFEILSGYFNEKTTGTPLTFVIYNNNNKSKDYDALKSVIRPGHGDYTGYVKYFGCNDYRGGGHFSGRLTAPLVFAGAIAKSLLEKKNIYIGTHVKSIGNIEDDDFNMTYIEKNKLISLKNEKLPVIKKDIKDIMEKSIMQAREEGDSLGGIIQCMVINLMQGLGAPFFDSVESRLAHILFSVPAVKGVEFGQGFNITKMKGSEANDQYVLADGEVKTTSNNNGGVLGGITNGMPLVFKVAIKPTPSITKPQKSIDLNTMVEKELEVKGRHDPCIIPRAIPVVEAVTALTIFDFILERETEKWD